MPQASCRGIDSEGSLTNAGGIPDQCRPLPHRGLSDVTREPPAPPRSATGGHHPARTWQLSSRLVRKVRPPPLARAVGAAPGPQTDDGARCAPVQRVRLAPKRRRHRMSPLSLAPASPSPPCRAFPTSTRPLGLRAPRQDDRSRRSCQCLWTNDHTCGLPSWGSAVSTQAYPSHDLSPSTRRKRIPMP